jgi:Phasin protein
MVAKKKPRKRRTTVPIPRTARDSAKPARRVAARVTPLPDAGAPGRTRVFPRMAAADVDALARSSVALADGVQSIGRAMIEIQRQLLSAGLIAARDLIDSRNLRDVIEVQRRFATGAVENAVRESGGLARLASRVADEAWAPLAPRLVAAWAPGEGTR